MFQRPSEVCGLSHCRLFPTPWTIACLAPGPWKFPSKNTGVGFHFLPLGDLPDPGIKLQSLASLALADRFFITEAPGKPLSEV